MGNKMKKLLCSLLAAAMVVSSASALVFAAEGDTATDAAETTVTETVADDSSTADQTDEEKEATDAEATTEATEAPAETAATEAPAEAVATEAPASSSSSSSSYDDDTYYQKALALCSSLGIISGFEDGSVRPDEKVTRAQMASIVLRMLAMNGTSPYQGIFSDVADTHWAASQIQSAYEAKIVSGMGDGTFAPDAEVTYAQVIVMLVNAMNYQDDAEYYGGWQQGYIKEAGELGLLKSASGSADVPSDRGVVIKMVYNALLGDYKEIRTYDEYGQPKYSTDKTLAEVKFDVIEAKGTLVGTAKTSLVGDLTDGQLAIIPEKETDYIIFDTDLTDLEDYLAQKVTYYYKDTTTGASEVVAVTYDSTKSEVYMIDDLDKVESITGFDTGNGSIKVEKVSKAKKATSDVSIVYNGKLLDPNDISEDDDINELLLPEEGSIKLVKSDKNNDDYDTIFVESYETVVVTSATETRLIGKIQDPDKAVGETKAVTYNLDDTMDRTITVTKAGTQIKLRNLKKNDVATIKASYSKEKNPSPEVMDVVVTGESITGSATSKSVKMDESYATVNGDRYDVANVAAGDLQTGVQCTFYLNMFGKIGFIEGTSGTRLNAGEKYGWIMDAYKSEDGSGYMVKLMTESGEQHLKLASKVDYWAPNAAEASGQVSSSELGRELVTMMADPASYFPATWAQSYRSGNTNYSNAETYRASWKAVNVTWEQNSRVISWTAGAPIMLVKYKTNSSGNLSRLYGGVSVTNYSPVVYDPDYEQDWDALYDEFSDGFDSPEALKKAWGCRINKNATDDSGNKCTGVTQPYLTTAMINSIKNSDALILDMNDHSGSTLVGGLVAGYVITDDIVEFQVPNDMKDYNDSDAYVVGNVTSSKYNLRENGLSDSWFAADADGTKPGALVRYVANASKPVQAADMDNVGGPSSMVVDSIDVGVDDDENTIYVINGYLGGSEVSVTTKKNSSLAELQGYYNNREYISTGGTSIVSWGNDTNANGNVWEAGDEDSGSYLTDFLHEGDIIITDGTYILIYASAQDIYTGLRKGEDVSKFVTGSETRNYFWFDRVIDSDFSDTPWMSVGGNTLSADASMSFDVVEIDLSARNAKSAVKVSDDLASIADVEVYSSDQDEYDYGYARFANKGGLQEVIIYRIKSADLIGVDADEEEVAEAK